MGGYLPDESKMTPSDAGEHYLPKEARGSDETVKIISAPNDFDMARQNRLDALKLAVDWHKHWQDANADQTIARAKGFEKYLAGQDS